MNQFNAINWEITKSCNAQPLCSYCIADVLESDTHPPFEPIIKEIIDGLSRLPSQYLIGLGGGEPVSHPDFNTKIIPYLLSQTQHTFYLTSNSVPDIKYYYDFVNQLDKRLTRLIFSYHAPLYKGRELEFVEKAVQMQSMLSKVHIPFQINIPMAPSSLSSIRVVVKTLLQKNPDIGIYPQYLKTRKGYPIEYSSSSRTKLDEIRKLLVANGQRPPNLNNSTKAISFLGQECKAGNQYFFINPNGKVYVCPTMFGENKGFVGNIRDLEFTLLQEKVVCEVYTCNCGLARICGATPTNPQTVNLIAVS